MMDNSNNMSYYAQNMTYQQGYEYPQSQLLKRKPKKQVRPNCSLE